MQDVPIDDQRYSIMRYTDPDVLYAFLGWYYHSMDPAMRLAIHQTWLELGPIVAMDLERANRILGRIPAEPRKVFKVFLGGQIK
jgi:hypothetical protein